MAGPLKPSVPAACVLAWLGALGAVPAQAPPLEIALRDGTTLLATELTGDPAQGVEVVAAGMRRRVAAGELLAVHGAPAKIAELPAAYLCGGEVVRGVVAGGDATGDHLELLSPVLGRVSIAVDRIAVLAAAGVARPTLLELPEGVGEALYLRAQVGYDLVAGTLHQFGEQGVKFQPAAGAARWYAATEFVALRIADAAPRSGPAPVQLLTRTGDRLGITVRKLTTKVVQCELEGGAVVDLRLSDLACLSFAGVGTFLSDLKPSEVAESGFEGDVVYPWQRDHAALGGPLLAGGRAHGKGLGVHSRSRLSFQVPEGCERFWTRVGLDDSAAELRVQANADVRVLVNGKLVFERLGLAAGRAPQDTGALPVKPGDTLTLEADFGHGRELGDRIDWLSPVFLPGGPFLPGGRRP
ncbi:MAG TPA: NPCBM/NEW2 domain-containing protein [Planctomycetota bacterium]|nr:NPCBM/NEW2 domain-containing protein [Planctomycetota bacterium]